MYAANIAFKNINNEMLITVINSAFIASWKDQMFKL